MKTLLLTIILGLSTLAHADARRDAVNSAREFYENVVDRFNVGEVTRTDVELAHKYLLDMQYFAGDLDKAAYCSAATDAQNLVLQGMEEEARVGQRTVEEVLQAKRDLSALNITCQ